MNIIGRHVMIRGSDNDVTTACTLFRHHSLYLHLMTIKSVMIVSVSMKHCHIPKIPQLNFGLWWYITILPGNCRTSNRTNHWKLFHTLERVISTNPLFLTFVFDCWFHLIVIIWIQFGDRLWSDCISSVTWFTKLPWILMQASFIWLW